MRSILGIIFDLDGVLVDSSAAWYELLNALLDEDGLPRVSPARFAESFGQSSAEDARVFFEGSLTAGELDARYNAAFSQHVSAITCIEARSPRVLEELRRRGVRTAIATNAPGVTSRAMLEATGLAGAVDTVVTPDDVRRPKPSPDMLIEALDRLRLTPDDALFVGDSASDVGAARAAGVRMVGFRIDAGHRIETIEELLGLLG